LSNFEQAAMDQKDMLTEPNGFKMFDPARQEDVAADHIGARTSSEYVNTDEEEGDFKSDDDLRDSSVHRSSKNKYEQQNMHPTKAGANTRSGQRVGKMKSEDRQVVSQQLCHDPDGAMQEGGL